MDDRPPSADEFRTFLADIGETQTSFSRRMTDMGDPRGPRTLLRIIQRMALGESKISGEMYVIMNLLRQGNADMARKSRSRTKWTWKMGTIVPRENADA